MYNRFWDRQEQAPNGRYWGALQPLLSCETEAWGWLVGEAAMVAIAPSPPIELLDEALA